MHFIDLVNNALNFIFFYYEFFLWFVTLKRSVASFVSLHFKIETLGQE